MTPAPPRDAAIAMAAIYATTLEARGEHGDAENVSRHLDVDLAWPEGASMGIIRALLGTDAPFGELCSTPFCDGRATAFDSTVCPECADNLERVDAMVACPPVPRGH